MNLSFFLFFIRNYLSKASFLCVYTSLVSLSSSFKVVVITVICTISLLFLYMVFLLCLDPLMSRRPRTYQEQRNEEVNLVSTIYFFINSFHCCIAICNKKIAMQRWEDFHSLDLCYFRVKCNNIVGVWKGFELVKQATKISFNLWWAFFMSQWFFFNSTCYTISSRLLLIYHHLWIIILW